MLLQLQAVTWLPTLCPRQADLRTFWTGLSDDMKVDVLSLQSQGPDADILVRVRGKGSVTAYICMSG